MNRVMDDLAARAATRRAAFDAQHTATRAISAAVLAAKGAGADTPSITAIATESYTRLGELPINALTRQGVHKILNTRTEEIPALWEAAGRPTVAAALDRLRECVAAAVPVVADYRRNRDALVAAMWAARDAGHGAAAVADASGFASKAAYEYLALRDDWRTVHGALAGLLDEREDEEPHFPLLLLTHSGTRFWVQNVAEAAHVDQRVMAALDPVGWQIPPKLTAPRFRGHWLPLEKREG